MDNYYVVLTLIANVSLLLTLKQIQQILVHHVILKQLLEWFIEYLHYQQLDVVVEIIVRQMVHLPMNLMR